MGAENAHPMPSTKTPRGHITMLQVETQHCPQVLLRILGLVAVHDRIPLTIASCRDETTQHIAIGLDSLPEQVGAILLNRVRNMVPVVKAELHRMDQAPSPLLRW